MEIAADIAHEFKTPLSVLKANLEAVKDGVIDEEMSIVNMISEVDRLSLLIDELKLIHNLDSGVEKLKMERINLSKLINKTVESYKVLARKKKIEIETINTGKDIYIKGDSSKLIQILENVLLNSIIYTPEKGRIEIKLNKGEKNALLEIGDTGIGISEEEIHMVFDRFYRTEESRSRDTGGSGLGLSIVKRLVEKMNGNIQIESEVGKGTQVIIRLPLA